MATLTVNIKMEGLESFDTLIGLLVKHKADLPSEVLEGISKICDTECLEIGRGEFEAKGLDVNTYRITVDGEDAQWMRIKSINPVLKRISLYAFDEDNSPNVDGEEFVLLHQYPKSLSMGDANNTLVEW
ncbi:hypothetical protein NVP1228O_12 [Vibrio phage 1.228.O._10N.261.49.C1]|nr:hypothetical protein NVP1157O_12 [Vibrio phage 1.157.O._10N.261.45.B7]AUR96606.1 hypothetical protein NVP1228O_12 [Vibrio phage 1.228.O._10N.261.49.C1]